MLKGHDNDQDKIKSPESHRGVMGRLKNTSTLFITALLLSSCAVYGTQFECKSSSGAKCTSISKVNAMVDKGLLTDDTDITEKASKQQKKQVEESKEEILPCGCPKSAISAKLKALEERDQKKVEKQLAKKKLETVKKHENHIDVWLPNTAEKEAKYTSVEK